MENECAYTVSKHLSWSRESTWGVGVLCVGLLGSCGRSGVGGPASPEQCRDACGHVASLNRGSFEDRLRTRLHEQEESTEVLEDEAKVNLDRLKLELAEKRVPFEDTLDAVRRVPAKTRRLLRERYELQGSELRGQREAALREAEAQGGQVRAKLERAMSERDQALKIMIDTEATACSKQCVDGVAPKKSVECMLRATSADAVPPCLIARGDTR